MKPASSLEAGSRFLGRSAANAIDTPLCDVPPTGGPTL